MPARGSGLLGLKDRAEAIGGTISLESRQGVGTTLIAELPLDLSSALDSGLARIRLGPRARAAGRCWTSPLCGGSIVSFG